MGMSAVFRISQELYLKTTYKEDIYIYPKESSLDHADDQHEQFARVGQWAIPIGDHRRVVVVDADVCRCLC